jgi:hypothetical protein
VDGQVVVEKAPVDARIASSTVDPDEMKDERSNEFLAQPPS